MHLLYLNVYNIKFIIWAKSTDFLKEHTDFFGFVQCIGCVIKIMLGLAVWRAGKRRDYLSYERLEPELSFSGGVAGKRRQQVADCGEVGPLQASAAAPTLDFESRRSNPG